MLCNAVWSNINRLFLYCVLRVIQLLDSVGSINTVRSVLKHILDLAVFAVPFPKLSKTLLKVGVSTTACILSASYVYVLMCTVIFMHEYFGDVIIFACLTVMRYKFWIWCL